MGADVDVDVVVGVFGWELAYRTFGDMAFICLEYWSSVFRYHLKHIVLLVYRAASFPHSL